MTHARPPHRRGRAGAPLLLVAVALVVLAACSPTENDTKVATAGLPDLGQALQSREWRLDPGDSTVSPANQAGITLRFDDDEHASGFAGCNTYSVRYDLDGHTIDFTDPVISERACEPEVMSDENLYLVAIAMPREADVTDPGRLVLTTGQSRLSYVGTPPGTEMPRIVDDLRPQG